MPPVLGTQLDLFPARPVELPPPAPREFVRGVPVDRRGLAEYVHLIRDSADPERTPRPDGGRADKAPHRTLARTSTVADWRARLIAHLADGVPRTFNRLGVELLDQTADMLLGSALDRALWQLVDAGVVEHTLDAPVLFRRCDPETVGPDP